MKKEIEKSEYAQPNERKLIQLILAEFGNTGQNQRSKKQLLLEAGFPPSIAKNPKLIYDRPIIKKFLAELEERFEENKENIIDEIDRIRHSAIKNITEKKLSGASPSVLTYVADTFIKNYQLLTGKDTSRLGFNLDDKEKSEIDAIFSKNKK